jgi:hypothetical protein
MTPKGESAIMPATKAEKARMDFILKWSECIGIGIGSESDG